MNIELLGRINEAGVKHSRVERTGEQDTQVNAVEQKQRKDDDDDEPPLAANAGQLIVDASCAPADIRYPTDLSRLNQAREQRQSIIDVLYEQLRGQVTKKPRTYRQQARQDYLQVAKQPKASHKTMRKAIGKQLGYVNRNLAHIDGLVAAGAS